MSDTDTPSLQTRLRDLASHVSLTPYGEAQAFATMREAADVLDKAEAEVARLRAVIAQVEELAYYDGPLAHKQVCASDRILLRQILGPRQQALTEER